MGINKLNKKIVSKKFSRDSKATISGLDSIQDNASDNPDNENGSFDVRDKRLLSRCHVRKYGPLRLQGKLTPAVTVSDTQLILKFARH